MIRKLIALTFAALLWACTTEVSAPERPALEPQFGCVENQADVFGAYCKSHQDAIDWIMSQTGGDDCEIYDHNGSYGPGYTHEVGCQPAFPDAN